MPPAFAIGYSGDWGSASALLAGADAWHSVMAGFLPVPALKLTVRRKPGTPARRSPILPLSAAADQQRVEAALPVLAELEEDR